MKVATIDAARRAKFVAACSFDVFDTFILRACTTPDGVFERTYELSGVSDSCPNVSESFVQQRMQAEARARKDAEEKRGSAEVRITDIYSFFPFRLFGLDRNAMNDLAVAEFRAELELCRANPEMLQQYLDMKRQGFRVGFISDTYWSSKQLAHLLRNCCPELSWDFLYVSCEQGYGKSDRLFAKYLSEQNLDPAKSFHIGDNESADIQGARRHGIRPRHYPQASPVLAARLQREASAYELLSPGRPSRLDHGMRTMRRMIAAQTPEKSPAFHLGLTIVGPVMAAFDTFVEARCRALDKAGRKVAVGFVGRDGFLSYRVWQDAREAHYLEINRRVATIASADTLQPLRDLLERIPAIDAHRFADLTKVLPPAVADFFATYPGGIVKGSALADALPQLMSPRESKELASGVRSRLLAYLRNEIPDFDSCTDLVLVDLGYAGSVQKALRRIFDRERVNIRLHGVYLLTLDDAFHDLAGNDTVSGLISDVVVTPHMKRALLRNVSLFEQICSAPEGSVQDYRDGRVQREPAPIPPAQSACIAEIQAGAVAFASTARNLAASHRLQPFAASDVAARWTAAMLARLLLLPDDEELALLGHFQHDVNLGTHTLQPLIDHSFVESQIIARGFTAACTVDDPPMWLAGSFASISPSYSYLYALFAANRLSFDVYGEAACGTVEIGIFKADGSASMEAVRAYRTAFGDIRLRIPVAQAMGIAMIVLPLGKFAQSGLFHGVVVQTGDTVADAAKSVDVTALADDRLVFAALERQGRHYHAPTEDGSLVISLERGKAPIAIYTIALTPLGGGRILAERQDAAEIGAWRLLSEQLAAPHLPANA